ncbi:hypothetical protein PPYR_04828 [Photinus pyralis]|uniref:Nudix hydrolase domain-containing protein n=1 Tax=Photinus pyralis TaxID=7054 RepID=A0A1Y1NB95_PHOPY|nr:8-oxo-dGDP phosphatase NUDT18-like [Photinus pyralis]XP_031332807.1 8-oxo-dGDP phosphatase NUDT18-like [Photinus pyralis]XP_031350892.1 8-oxo-dGDP phosphatase NUDT18-like [Photinus pyralis]XP_031350893.1 8-oxo-dGDP phosphatase NUDT18-like [Photinus pyralis]KAB0795043.1 hypothetical protein PPYR_11882 [Photinus pyralis]KAB0802642.1 hypothetical protein PPYR_04828 [Photinus pyralis]
MAGNIIEIWLDKILKGRALEDEQSTICDFSIDEQITALESQGIAPNVAQISQPVLGETVTYIVAAVLLNEKNEVLMMQEAKQSCAGKWYLPAGRVEKNENISEAAAREVLEETGLVMQCTTLLTIECAGGTWIRFVVTGKVIGGTLKTPSQADSESLQAKWVYDLNELTLRGKDIVPIVERARTYVKAQKMNDKTWHQEILPAPKEHSSLLLRLVILIKKRSTNRVHVLISERTAFHLPVCEIHPAKSLHSTLRRFMVELFGAEVAPHRPHGVLSVEHNCINNKDGLCLTMLVVFRAPLEEVPIIGKCVWHETSMTLGETLMIRVGARNSTIPINVIR